ncbi:DUF2786 domain-containing protein [Niveispirillum sp. KHB5.9]|uniref:DUF7168 domain-containing protein n=1 Tax=Niveispirillum sp. KHB5.9 TaxID=3400269 RepID=UPI003A89629E
MADREKLRAKIRALRARTVANGCTEAEAAAAADLALRLMQQAGIDTDEVDKPDWEEAGEPTQGRRGPQDDVYRMVAYVSGCAQFSDRTGERRRMVYVGRAPYPEVAAYLHRVCHGAMERALRDFHGSAAYKAKRKPHTRAAARRAFLEAMAERLSRTLLGLHQQLGRTGHKAQLAEAWAYRDQSYALTTPRHQVKKAGKSQRLDKFRDMGDQAGRSVNVNLGVRGGGAPLPALIHQAGED